MEKYSSPVTFGSKYLKDFDLEHRVVQEKVDGSQFSFGLNADGKVVCRSRGAIIDMGSIDNAFKAAVKHVVEHSDMLEPGLIYRAEAVTKPRHNKLIYGRAAKGGIVLFDIESEDGKFMNQDGLIVNASRLKVDVAPQFRLLAPGEAYDEVKFREDCKNESVLGGKIEGVVIKNYSRRFSQSGGLMVAKWVTDEFKEKMQKFPKPKNTEGLAQKIAAAFKTEARWHKAVQHLKEEGKLEMDAKDIGALIREIHADLERECVDELKDMLYDAAIKEIKREVVEGFPQWYKKGLIDEQF